jgi:2-dehydropantoate 2-reductase
MHVGICGAGAIGAYVGLRLSAIGVPVVMLARSSLVEQAERLQARDLEGNVHRPGPELRVTVNAEALARVDVCLVTVKSRDTVSAARMLRDHLSERTLVVSLQNGLHNAQRLRTELACEVVAGMVGFNVRRDDASFVHATRAPLVTGRAAPPHDVQLESLIAMLNRAGVTATIRADIDAVLAGKLLLNLNNGVCALTGVGIAESLRDRRLRWCLAQLMREGHAVMRAAGLRPASVVGVPPWLIARLLPLPDAIVLRVAKAMVSVDPRARSSTLVDLEAGKPTEIEDLSGEIVSLGASSGHAAPANALIVQAVHALESGPRPPAFWSPEQLRECIDEALGRAP